jgi:glycosyltransferase involved in cell wall biosynthesis
MQFVSVVVPTFNEEKYLEPTLKALRNQTYNGKYEIIVSDSNSKDGTLKIAEKYADRVVSVDKRGIAVGRNAGAKEAKGEILVFVDADTLTIHNTLAEIVRPFEEKGVVGVAVPVLPLSPKIGDILLYLGFNDFVKVNVEHGKGRARVIGACCAYKKRSFDDVGGFNEELQTLEDFDLSERVSKLGKMKYTQKTMALVSTRRIVEWGKGKSIEKYLRLYFRHLLTERGLKHIPEIDYRPVR